MKEVSIKHLTYILKEAKKNNQPRPIFFLGAGASKSGNIPLAKEIVNDISENYSHSPSIEELSVDQHNYPKLMECLQPYERDTLLKKYIDGAKINVTHIYLAQLMHNDFIDYVLTVNFDNLMLRALALLNEFPPTYDMAILKDLTTSTFKKKSVVFLHGQHHGLWLLNTKEEMGTVSETVPRIFDSIKDKRPWIFLGYSGDDPIFDHIQKMGRFDNGLYWVAYKENNPSDRVMKFLHTSNTNAHILKGYDSDSFMLKLNNELGIPEPMIIDRPFSCVKDMLDNIVDIDDEDHFKGVKERLAISKEQVNEAIDQFEKGKIVSKEMMQKRSETGLLKKEMINLIIKKEYKEDRIDEIYEVSKEMQDTELNNILADLYSDWGVSLGDLANTKKGVEAEKLYQEALRKFKQANLISPNTNSVLYNWATYLGNFAKTKDGTVADNLFQKSFNIFEKVAKNISNRYEIFNNWGNALGHLAKTKSGKIADKLFHKSFIKFEKAAKINPFAYEIFYNWGTYLGNLAQNKMGKEAEELFCKAFNKFEKAILIKPDDHMIFSNWGMYLENLARNKNGNEADKLFQEALQKFEKANFINPNNYDILNNWGNTFGNYAHTKHGEDADRLFQEAFIKYHKASLIIPDKYDTFNNWGIFLGQFAQTKKEIEADRLFQKALHKFTKADYIEPDNYSIFINWGVVLGDYAKTKDGPDSEKLYKDAFEKYHKASNIKPDDSSIFYIWGISLVNFAKMKDGDEAEKLYKDAFNKYQKATIIKPDFQTAFESWAFALEDFAKTKNGQETERLNKDAFDKYQKATIIKPDDHNIFSNWGVALGNFAKMKDGQEAERLYKDAFDKYQKATIIKPDFQTAFSNWGTILGLLAQMKQGDEAESLYEQAIEKHRKAIECGASYYNLACIYALKMDKKNALKYLEICLANGNTKVEFIENDDDWKLHLEDEDFVNLLDKYRT